MHIIKSADFIGSYVDYKKCPVTTKREFAFIGRSNVGKSSLINFVCNKKGLAKTSSTPGKTQLINLFDINGSVIFTDLPGYGYAKSSKTNLKTWEKFIADYLVNRENLYCVFVLIDSRHAPQQIDKEFMEWLNTKGVPFIIVFTKADKLGKTQLQSALNTYKKEMLKDWEEMPQSIVTSATDKKGKDEILKVVFGL